MPPVGGTSGASARPPVPINPVKRGRGTSETLSPASASAPVAGGEQVEPAPRRPPSRRPPRPPRRYAGDPLAEQHRRAFGPRLRHEEAGEQAAADGDARRAERRRVVRLVDERQPAAPLVEHPMPVVAMPPAATSRSRPIARSPFIPLGARVRKTPSLRSPLRRAPQGRSRRSRALPGGPPASARRPRRRRFRPPGPGGACFRGQILVDIGGSV